MAQIPQTLCSTGKIISNNNFVSEDIYCTYSYETFDPLLSTEGLEILKNGTRIESPPPTTFDWGSSYITHYPNDLKRRKIRVLIKKCGILGVGVGIAPVDVIDVRYQAISNNR